MTLLPEVGNKHLFRCEHSLLAVNECSCSTEAIDTSVALVATPHYLYWKQSFMYTLQILWIFYVAKHNDNGTN